jgi:hypothetical protein
MLLLHPSQPPSIIKHRPYIPVCFLIVARPLLGCIISKVIQEHTQTIVHLSVHLVMPPSVEIMISSVTQKFTVEINLINVKDVKRASQGKRVVNIK